MKLTYDTAKGMAIHVNAENLLTSREAQKNFIMTYKVKELSDDERLSILERLGQDRADIFTQRDSVTSLANLASYNALITFLNFDGIANEALRDINDNKGLELAKNLKDVLCLNFERWSATESTGSVVIATISPFRLTLSSTYRDICSGFKKGIQEQITLSNDIPKALDELYHHAVCYGDDAKKKILEDAVEPLVKLSCQDPDKIYLAVDALNDLERATDDYKASRILSTHLEYIKDNLTPDRLCIGIKSAIDKGDFETINMCLNCLYSMVLEKDINDNLQQLNVQDWKNIITLFRAQDSVLYQICPAHLNELVPDETNKDALKAYLNSEGTKPSGRNNKPV